MSSNVEAYRRAVSCLLDNWQALSIAVEHSFGGQYSSEKADWLKGVMCEFLTSQQSARSADEVEDYLTSLMDQEFDTIVEDGSITEISRQLVKLWYEWKPSSEQPEIKAAPQPAVIKAESTIENGRATVETEAENKAEDDDGWTVVSRRR